MLRTMALLIVFLVILVAEETRSDVLNQHEDQWTSIIQATINSYDIDKPYYENFFSILYAICPSSVHCDGRNVTELNFSHLKDHFNDTFDLSKGSIQKKNDTKIDEARRYLESRFSDRQNYCKKCSCTDDCKNRNKCCPLNNEDETLNIQKSMIEAQRCIFPTVYNHTSSKKSVGRSFYMITHCSNGSFAEDVIRKCKYPRQDVLSEMIPVYSKTANKLYRNKHCAQCNNEFRWISWQLKVYFPDVVTLTALDSFLSSPDTLYHKFLKTRRITLSVKPPEEFLEQKRELEFICTHPEHYIEVMCTRIPNLNEYQKYFLKFACSYYQSTYNCMYKNVFCYMCHMVFVNMQTYCEGDVSKTTRTSFTGLFVVNDEGVENMKAMTTQNDNCTCREYFYKQQDTCRPLICPRGKVYMGCSCESVLGNITGLALNVVVDIVPEKPTIKTLQLMNGTTTDKLVKQVKTIVYKMFKTKWGKMELQLLFMNRETLLSDSSHLKFHAVFFMRSRLVTDNMVLWKDVYNDLKSKIRINFLKTSMLLSLGKIVNVYDRSKASFVVDYEPAYSTNVTFVTLYSYKYLSVGLTSDQLLANDYLSKYLFCKRITLNDEEVLSLLNSSISEGYSGGDISHVFDASEQQICFDDFVTNFIQPKSKAYSCQTLKEIVYVVACLSLFMI